MTHVVAIIQLQGCPSITRLLKPVATLDQECYPDPDNKSTISGDKAFTSNQLFLPFRLICCIDFKSLFFS